MFTAVQAVSIQLDPGSKTFWALLPVFVLTLGLICYALLDLVRAPRVRYLPKWLWALIIMFGSAPLGALVYLVVGRSHRDTLEQQRSDRDIDAETDSDVEAGDLPGRRLGGHERAVRL